MKMTSSFSYSQGRVKLEIWGRWIGAKDVVVELTGGDRPHIGAVALAQVRPSLKNPEKINTTTSVLTCLGHREGDLARKMASRIAKQAKINIVVICGIHLDHISKEEIQDVLIGAALLEGDILKWIEYGYSVELKS